MVPKCVRLTQNETNPGLLQIRFGTVSRNLLKSDLQKSRIGLILGQSGPLWNHKADIVYH